MTARRLSQVDHAIDQAPARKAHRYETIKQHIVGQIRSGCIKPGDKIGPLSKLSKFFGVSRLTVIRALQDLEITKVVKNISGRGFFVHDALGEHRFLEIENPSSLAKKNTDAVQAASYCHAGRNDAYARTLFCNMTNDLIHHHVRRHDVDARAYVLEEGFSNSLDVLEKYCTLPSDQNHDDALIQAFSADDVEVIVRAAAIPTVACDDPGLELKTACLIAERIVRKAGNALLLIRYTYAGDDFAFRAIDAFPTQS